MSTQFDSGLHHPSSQEHESGSFITLLKKISVEHGNVVDQLQLLSDEGDTKSLDRALTQLALTILRDTFDFKANANIVHAKNTSDIQKREAISSQRNLVNQMKRLIALEAGIKDGEWLNDIEVAKQTVRNTLDNAAKEGKIESNNDILIVLGIINTDQEGNNYFTYPAELFPEFVDEQWQAYLESVSHHLEVESELKAGLRDKSDLQDADTSRRIAHNAVSRSVQQILGIEDWSLDDARRLLAKMRDNRFPNIASGESHRTADGIARGIGSEALMAVLNVLSSRSSIDKLSSKD